MKRKFSRSTIADRPVRRSTIPAVADSTSARRCLSATLLAATCLTPILLAAGAPSAWADGGTAGGISGNPGGVGGVDSAAGIGANGGSGGGNFGGGGGGSGATGGAGGVGGNATPGGAGGTTPGASGVAGSGGVPIDSGGGGGGGGAHGRVLTTSTTDAGATGGSGGAGGVGALGSGGGGGGGGAGGWGVVVNSSGLTYTNTGIAAGGAGGSGGNGVGNQGGGGGGGSGGIGVAFAGSGTLNNSGSISGGNGGVGAIGSFQVGTNGAGGAGIVGSDLTITNSGTITGGSSGGGPQANAITFTGGANALTLQAGSIISGNIDVTGSLTFSQPTDATLANVVSGTGSVAKVGTGTLTLTGFNTYSGATTISTGTLALSGSADISSSSLVTINAGATFNVGDNFATQINALAGSGTVQLGSSAGMEIVNASGVFSGVITSDPCGCSTLAIGGGTQTLSGTNTYTGTTALASGATLALLGSGSIASSVGVEFIQVGPGVATFDISQTTSGAVVGGLVDLDGVGVVSLGSKTLTVGPNGGPFAGIIQDGGIGGGLTIASPGFGLQLAGVNTYAGATTVLANGVLAVVGNGSIASSSGVNLAGPGALFDISGSAVSQMIKDLSGGAGTTLALGGNALTVGTANSASFAGTIVDGGLYGGTGGSLVKTGSGTLTLTGANSYTGGTTVTGGLINFAALTNFGTGQVTLNGGGVQWAAGTSTDISARLAPLGAAGGTFDTNGNNVTFATALSGPGGLTKQGLGQLTLTGNNTFTGATMVTGGILAVNGSLASGVTLNDGILAGSGTIGGLLANGGIVAPGNSIGTLTVNGNVVQNAGNVYQVEVNAAGQGDRINASGTATINGAAVQVLAASGSYANSTTYTILNATGGVSGTYSGVTSNFAFLTPTLTYDPNNVFLTLALQGNAFSGFGGNTPNQRAVGYALDQSFTTASGDFATVIGALAGLSTAQASPTLNTISGQPYADFGTVNIASNALFMNVVGQQMALARGTGVGGQRLALAQACAVEACEEASPWSVWASALGGLGSVAGNANSSTLTYNFGGGAAGIDYRLDPRFLVGIGAGYSHGTQWVDSFMGKGWTDAVSVTAYGSFTQAGFYADALAGYAYSSNQLQRQIQISGLQQRTANGSTGANQFLGQVETGYKIPVFAAAQATLTPFGRLQVSSVNQAAFSEWGANSLSLNVAQQTTNSLRSTVGADLAGEIGFGNQRTLALALRLGWQHEFADTGRPITAAFAGAPTVSFTVLGATPQRDSAVIGFSARTNIADSTQLYLRYDGEVGGGTDNHALNVGVRLSW
jgi:fibronectin-binding autotransporter adhesin